MTRPSGSILRKLQLAFALSATLLAGLMAVFMDRALHRSLEAEDALVMEGQARAMLQRLAAGEAGPETGGRPVLEKAEWRVLDREGRILAQSGFMAGLPPLVPPPDAPAQEVETAEGRIYSILARPWRAVGGRAGGTLFLAMDRSHEQALTAHFRRTLALAVGLAALVAAMVARWVAAWGLAPLARIAREAGTIDDRHLDRRLEAAQFPGELRDLVDTLNAALARLQAAFERTDRLGAELAHELRTPLQNLRSTLENQALAPGGSEAQRSALGGLLEECDRMAALIDQILFLARAEGGPGRLAREPIDVPGLLEEVRGFFEASAEEAGVALQVAAPPGVLAGDRLLLTRALHNLVANALRHTAQGGRVVLGADTAPGATALWVEDTGSGIAPEWIPRLGQPFTRPPEPRPEGGLGLGLAIVARIAAMLGGTMDIQSRVGQGTRVTLRIPNLT